MSQDQGWARSAFHEARPAARRDADGRIAVASTWEALAERLIREAQERGEFDELPHQGQPLDVADNPYAGDQALALHVLRNAGVAPPWIEADKEARRLIAARDALLANASGASLVAHQRHQRQLTAIAETHRRTIARLNAEAPTTRQHRRAMVLADELDGLERAWRSLPFPASRS
jgi:hypothetical protein